MFPEKIIREIHYLKIEVNHGKCIENKVNHRMMFIVGVYLRISGSVS